MLYVTTRSNRDVYTAPRTLADDRGPDGGLYVPFRMPVLEDNQLNKLGKQSFGQWMADILNLFFSVRLTGWDVDFCIGRNSCKVNSMNYRLFIAEVWNNQEWDFQWTVKQLCKRLECENVSDWARMAIRVGALFGVFSELRRCDCWDGRQPLDVAVPAGDFSAPMAAWYARHMGLPVGTIICACNENSNPWDLLNYGQMHTDSAVINTLTPEGDHGVPTDLERLICAVLGHDEALRYSAVNRSGRMYNLDTESAELIRKGMFAAVVGSKRMQSIIPSVAKTNNFLLDPYAALAYGGLQDFRAKTGEVRPTLIMMEKSPSRSVDVVAKAMGMPVRQLKEQYHLA